MVAPTTIAAQYIAPVWKGAVILSFVWFLHRWKTNIIARALATKSGVDRDKLLTLDRVSSVGLFVLGLMTLAEACGVAVQSILTVGGIGGEFSSSLFFVLLLLFFTLNSCISIKISVLCNSRLVLSRYYIFSGLMSVDIRYTELCWKAFTH